MAVSSEQTSTQVANLALAHCGISKPMAALSTERSIEAQMCRTFYDLARQNALQGFPWSFAARQVAPSLVANQPTPEWLYAYQYPEDALQIIRFMSWRLNNDTRQSRIPYRVMQPVSAQLSTLATTPTYTQTTGLWIYTNWPGSNTTLPVILEYTFDNQDVSQWTPGFIMSFSYALASLIVTTLTSGNPQQQQQAILALYKASLSDAQNSIVSEEQRPQDPQSEFIRARDGESYGVPGQEWIAEPSGFEIE